MRSLPKPNRIRKEQGFEIVGMVWTRETFMWERHLLRRYRNSKALDWSKMTYVDADDSDICLLCLSQKVIYEVDGEFVVYRCVSCGITFRFVEEQTPPPKPKQLPPGDDLPPLSDPNE